jgi:hypothetical protein
VQLYVLLAADLWGGGRGRHPRPMEFKEEAGVLDFPSHLPLPVATQPAPPPRRVGARLDEARAQHATLVSAEVRLRPRHLLGDIRSQQTFLERPAMKRQKGSDRWMTSGGRKGATEIWISAQQGVLKRYGRVQRDHGIDGEKLRFAQFTLISRANELAPSEEVGGATLWELYSLVDEKGYASAQARQTAVPPAVVGPCGGLRIRSQPPPLRAGAPPPPPSLLLRAEKGQKFLSFQATPTDGGAEGMELGAVVRSDVGGVKLTSTQGDFAEWHRLADGQPPLAEGEVVGFHRGRISRVTRRSEMLGIVTRKAVVEGSAPLAHERHLYDTVAYQGVVPVRVSNQQQRGKQQLCECPAPRAGQLLVPSGKNDGLARLVPATQGEASSRVGILLHDQTYGEEAGDGTGTGTSRDDGRSDSWRLVDAVVVSPAETVAGSAMLLGKRAGLGPLVRVGMLIVVLVIGTSAVWMDLFQRLEAESSSEQPRSSTGSRVPASPPCDVGEHMVNRSCEDVHCSDWGMARNLQVNSFSQCEENSDDGQHLHANRSDATPVVDAPECCREMRCLPVDTPFDAKWSDEGAWKHSAGAREFAEVHTTGETESLSAGAVVVAEAAGEAGGDEKHSTRYSVLSCDDSTGSTSSLISLTSEGPLGYPGCTGYSGLPYDCALSECEDRCLLAGTCSGYTTYHNAHNKTTICCFRVNQADSSWSYMYGYGQSLTAGTRASTGTALRVVSGSDTHTEKRCYGRSQPFAVQPAHGYVMANRSGITVSALGSIRCDTGYVPEGRRNGDFRRSPEATPTASCAHDGQRFLFTGCAPTTCNSLISTVRRQRTSLSLSGGGGANAVGAAVAADFFSRYPTTTTSVQDYLRAAPPEATLNALFGGAFDSGLLRYTVDRPDATSAPDLGTVGCALGYKGCDMQRHYSGSATGQEMLTSTLAWPAMHCDEPYVSDPTTTAWADSPDFYGNGCVPNDSCERRQPCPTQDDDETPPAIAASQNGSSCAAEAKACTDAMRKFRETVGYNRAVCEATGPSCQYCVRDDRLPTVLDSAGGGGGGLWDAKQCT